MFELSDIIVERIIFAMEDQERAFAIDAGSGDLVPIPPGGEPPESAILPPRWVSRDGFQVMEKFCLGIRNPTLRRELSAVLGRGKGVFKAFKETLAAWPEADRSWRDFKAKSMRPRIDEWYGGLLEARGLSRLKGEPEDLADLVSSEMEIRLVALDACPAGLEDLLDKATEEAWDFMPASIVERESASVSLAMTRPLKGGYVAYVEDGVGGMLAAACGVREHCGSRVYARVRFLYVRGGFRRMGLGTAMLVLLGETFAGEGIGSLMLDSLLLPAEYGEALAARGYRPLGVRSMAPSPD